MAFGKKFPKRFRQKGFKKQDEEMAEGMAERAREGKAGSKKHKRTEATERFKGLY